MKIYMIQNEADFAAADKASGLSFHTFCVRRTRMDEHRALWLPAPEWGVHLEAIAGLWLVGWPTQKIRDRFNVPTYATRKLELVRVSTLPNKEDYEAYSLGGCFWRKGYGVYILLHENGKWIRSKGYESVAECRKCGYS